MRTLAWWGIEPRCGRGRKRRRWAARGGWRWRPRGVTGLLDLVVVLLPLTPVLALPLSLAMLRVLLVQVQGQAFGFTAQHVAELVRLPRSALLPMAITPLLKVVKYHSGKVASSTAEW